MITAKIQLIFELQAMFLFANHFFAYPYSEILNSLDFRKSKKLIPLYS